MLELILNSAWLVTGAIFAFYVLAVQQDRSRVLVRIVTVICLMMVLFPVVSLSDDLSLPEAALIDLSHSADQSSGNTGVDHTSSVAVALATSAAAIRLQFLHFAEPAQQHHSYAGAYVLSTDALRAPPASL